MINTIDFKAKNITSHAGLFLLFEQAKNEGIFELIEQNLIFENTSTNRIKMNHIKTMICGHFIGIDKLERLKVLRVDPLIDEFDIQVKEPETVSRFLNHFSFKTTQMLRNINFKVFKGLFSKKKLKFITIDIDSSVINVEGHQEGAIKGYNPKKRGNRCYNIQFAFCDELKAYVTGSLRSGDAHSKNGACEMIKELVANIKTEDVDILFRMDNGYFDEEIIKTIEFLGCKYLIKGKAYSTLVSKVTDPFISFVKDEEGREMAEIFTRLNTWDKDRRFVVYRVPQPKKDREQLSLIQEDEYQYFFFVTNTEESKEDVIINYEKRGNCENYIKEAKYDMGVGSLLLKSFWANEAVFQLMMLAYNVFLIFKFHALTAAEYRQQVKTFRLKYVFLPAKIVRTARYVIMRLSRNYPYKTLFERYLS